MPFMDTLITIFELIGTIAFSISGAFVALDHKMDIFGVVMLGVITATCGGVLRDIILGHFPPDAFVNPVYVLCAAVTAVIVFLYYYFHAEEKGIVLHGSRLLLVMDSLGLGIFSVMGVETAARYYSLENGFLLLFAGVITGVGGGLIRDMIVSSLPDIFAKHIYAIASIIGSYVTVILFRLHQPVLGGTAGVGIILAIRLAAAHYHWSLPKAERKKDS